MGTTSSLGAVAVGVDGSPGSDRAVDWAADYASMTGRRLHVVHGTGFVGVRPNAEDLLEAERVVLEGGRALVGAAVDRALRQHPELTAVGTADVGDPPTVLMDEARNAALLVVGCRRSATSRRMFGSVSLTAVRHARRPVVVVREHDRGGPPPITEHVVLGVDGTSASRDAAGFAFDYAAVAGLSLLVVHGSWERLSRGSSALEMVTFAAERGLTEEEELSIAETIAGLPEKYPDVDFREIHRTADPAEALVEASESAQLVVVGARRRGRAKAILLRSVSTALAEHAHCPVAVVPAED